MKIKADEATIKVFFCPKDNTDRQLFECAACDYHDGVEFDSAGQEKSIECNFV